MSSQTDTSMRESVLDALKSVEDPEFPVSIVDLGMVRDVEVSGPHYDIVSVNLTPTFLGCPALLFIERDVRAALETLDGVHEVSVRWRSEDPWSVDDLTEKGREDLRQLGVATPNAKGDLECPYCGSSEDVRIESEFGATLCRKIAYCQACQNPVEVMKRHPADTERPSPPGDGPTLPMSLA